MKEVILWYILAANIVMFIGNALLFFINIYLGRTQRAWIGAIGMIIQVIFCLYALKKIQ